jgi:hypothetical protein
LCTAVTLLRRCRASAKAASAMRVEPARGQREVGRGHELAGAEKHRAVGVEALGVLARDHEVDGRAAAGRKAAAAARRADIGEQVEALAQFARRIETALRHGRIVIVRDRPEDHAVGRARRLGRGVGHRRPVRAQCREAHRDR